MHVDDPIYELAELGCGIKPQDSQFTLRRRAEDAEQQMRAWRFGALLAYGGWFLTVMALVWLAWGAR